MIELPECYVLAEQLNTALKGKTIADVIANHDPHKFAWFDPEPGEYKQRLLDRPFTLATPGTRYTCGGNTELLFDDRLLVISTPIRFFAYGEKLPKKHQLLLKFTDGSVIACTVQMWGSLFLLNAKQPLVPNSYKLAKGPSPLENAFDRAYFDGLAGDCAGLSAKAFLATEQRVPGLGNGVLQDILFRAGIHPKRRLSTLSEQELDRLFQSVKDTLREMVGGGGRDTERDLFGCPGGYRTIFSKKTASEPCPLCGGGIVRESYLGGSIYYCPRCQPLPV